MRIFRPQGVSNVKGFADGAENQTVSKALLYNSYLAVFCVLALDCHNHNAE
jgi:hypothetical protein